MFFYPYLPLFENTYALYILVFINSLLLELSSLILCKFTHPSFDRIKKPIKVPIILKLTNILSYCIYFSIHFCRSELFHFHCRHAEFISVSGVWVVKVEILKKVQDDGVWVHAEFIQVTILIVLNFFISIVVMVNLFQYLGLEL